MIKVYFNDEEKFIEEGTTVFDLIDDAQKTNFMVCQIDAQIKEINRKK